MNWDNPKYSQFAQDLDAVGLDVYSYRGRNFYDGPAVNTSPDATLQDIIRATNVDVQWDNLGLGYVVYPR